MTQLQLLRALMPVSRILLPLASRRRRYQLLHPVADGILWATFPIRRPGLWWYCRRIHRAARKGQTIIEG